MARRVASGQLGLSSPFPAGDCTSESEAESVRERSRRVPAPAPEQRRCGGQPGEHLGTEDRAESGDSDLEPALTTSTGEE